MGNKDRLREFHRGNILNAAKRLFIEKGIAQTTVDDIAKEADYSKSTLYVYFKSKEEIYNHIILEYIQLLKQAIADVLRDSAGFSDGYFAICNALVNFRAAYPLYFESILGEVKLPEKESEAVLFQIYRIGEELNGIIETYFKIHLQQGEFSGGISALQMTFILWASIGGIITMANKKEAYIHRAMGVTKDEFMQNAFKLLLKSITYEKEWEDRV